MQKIPPIFAKVCELGATLGWENISLDPGCHEHQIDAGWWMAINPHAASVLCSHGYMVRPLSICFEWCGHPAGYVDAEGGMLACGAQANEDTLWRALDKAIVPPI